MRLILVSCRYLSVWFAGVNGRAQFTACKPGSSDRPASQAVDLGYNARSAVACPLIQVAAGQEE
jgi:hypothetical protein